MLLSEFDHDLETPPLRPALDEMVVMDVEADLAEIRKPIPPAPTAPEALEQLFTTSVLAKAAGIVFEQAEHNTWKLTYQQQNYAVTFYPNVFDASPSLRLMSFGDPLFEELLRQIIRCSPATSY